MNDRQPTRTAIYVLRDDSSWAAFDRDLALAMEENFGLSWDRLQACAIIEHEATFVKSPYGFGSCIDIEGEKWEAGSVLQGNAGEAVTIIPSGTPGDAMMGPSEP